jgi:hypothetical protein
VETAKLLPATEQQAASRSRRRWADKIQLQLRLLRWWPRLSPTAVPLCSASQALVELHCCRKKRKEKKEKKKKRKRQKSEDPRVRVVVVGLSSLAQVGNRDRRLRKQRSRSERKKERKKRRIREIAKRSVISTDQGKKERKKEEKIHLQSSKTGDSFDSIQASRERGFGPISLS